MTLQPKKILCDYCGECEHDPEFDSLYPELKEPLMVCSNFCQWKIVYYYSEIIFKEHWGWFSCTSCAITIKQEDPKFIVQTKTMKINNQNLHACSEVCAKSNINYLINLENAIKLKKK